MKKEESVRKCPECGGKILENKMYNCNNYIDYYCEDCDFSTYAIELEQFSREEYGQEYEISLLDKGKIIRRL